MTPTSGVAARAEPHAGGSHSLPRGGMARPSPLVSARTGAPGDVPWILRPAGREHKCKLCTIRLPREAGRLCAHCAERPEAADLFGLDRKGWTDGEVRALREMREEGLRVADIAARLGRSAGSVQQAISRFGLPYQEHQMGWRDRWRPEHDDLLRRRYNSQSERLREIYAALPEFKRHQIRYRASELGLTRVAHRRWTPAEDERLRELTRQGASLAMMGKLLRRSIGAVRQHVRDLHIRRLEVAGHTASSVAHGLGCTSDVVYRWIKAGHLRAIHMDGQIYIVTPADLRAFLVEHRDLWSLRTCSKAWLVQALTSCCGPAPKEDHA